MPSLKTNWPASTLLKWGWPALKSVLTFELHAAADKCCCLPKGANVWNTSVFLPGSNTQSETATANKRQLPGDRLATINPKPFTSGFDPKQIL